MALLALSACASLPKDIEPLPEQFALPPATTGLLADIDAFISHTHEPDQSGFWLLDKNADALTWRLALIDEAVSSLDLMYYVWYDDDSGGLLLR
ncbi:MAG: phospholipase D family protein, partial [Proteobacteria bacterium]|nr:phospholipase D family protein [Pseudomonadota bacterium]